MTNVHTTMRPSERGFTLVELAIVMVIIGLLIGGVLKGQELIGNARITATVAQFKAVDAALNGFQDKYNALPGDIVAPDTRLPDCLAAPCNVAGDGNGRIHGTPNAAANAAMVAPTNANEAGVAYTHLSAGEFIGGVSPDQGFVFGGMLPRLPTNTGGSFISWAGTAAPVTNMRAQRHYLITTSDLTALPGVGNGPFSGVQASQLDTKLDDGDPAAGSLYTSGTGCRNAGPPVTYITTGGGTCTVAMRVLN